MYHQLQHTEILRSAHSAFTWIAWISEKNIYYFSLQEQIIGFHNLGRECLLRSTNWVSRSDRHNFVLKVLKVATVNCTLYFRRRHVGCCMVSHARRSIWKLFEIQS